MSSGDVGHFDAGGRLFVDGRDDEMIVSGGENVFPREVEDLLADHEAVDEVAVIGVDDEEFGQRLKAFVVLARGRDASTPTSSRTTSRRNLARYKVPREIVFLDELPRNATGKVLKRELAERDDARRAGARRPRSAARASPYATPVVGRSPPRGRGAGRGRRQASTGLGFALILSPARLRAARARERRRGRSPCSALALNGLVLFGERRRPRVAWGEVAPDPRRLGARRAVCGVLILRALPKSVLQIAVGVAVIGAAVLRAGRAATRRRRRPATRARGWRSASSPAR